MKKFALFAMLICAGLINFGCSSEKPKEKPDKPAAATTDEKPADKPADEKPADKPAEK
jgi:hypothetical protein